MVFALLHVFLEGGRLALPTRRRARSAFRGVGRRRAAAANARLAARQGGRDALPPKDTDG